MLDVSSRLLTINGNRHGCPFRQRPTRRERVGLKGMDEVLDKLRAAAGAKRP